MKQKMTVLYTMFMENSLTMDNKYQAEYKQPGILKVQNIKNNNMQFSHHLLFVKLNQKQQLRGVARKRCSENMRQIYSRAPIPKYDYWNLTSAWVFSCKFAAYFQNTFSQEHLWVVASVEYKPPMQLTFSNNIIVSSKEIFSKDFKNTIQKNEFYHEKLEKLLELQLS